MPLLLVKTDDGMIKTFDMPEGKPVFVGRAPECDVHLHLPAVSRRHAVFVHKNGICAVKDLNSFNGTQINGRRTTAPEELSEGDTVQISTVQIRIVLSSDAVAGATSASQRRKSDRQIGARMFPDSGLPLPRSMERASVADSLLGGVTATPDRERGDIDDTQGAAFPSVDTSFFTPTYAPRSEEVTNPPLSPVFTTKPSSESVAQHDDSLKIKPGTETDAREALLQEEEYDYQEDEEPLSPDEEDFSKPNTLDIPVPATLGLETISLPSEFLTAFIESRMPFHSHLADLAEERKLFRMQGALSTEAEAELLRQEAELGNMPEPMEADALIGSFHERRAAKENEHREPDTTRRNLSAQQMIKAEDMAVSQWVCIRDLGQNGLKDIAEKAYPIIADEPFAQELSRADIDHKYFLGLTGYHLALEVLAGAAKEEQQRLSTQIETVDDSGQDNNTSVLAKIGRFASCLANRSKNREQLDQLAEEKREMEKKIRGFNREMAYIRRILQREFWHLYTEVALHYVPSPDAMPLSVRAFLRYGAIGFKAWWMREEVREHIVKECEQSIIGRLSR